MVYNLSYELKTPDKDYSELFTFLEHRLGKGGIHVLRDCWWIASDTPLNVDETSDEIRKLMGEKDIFHFGRLPETDVNGWLPSSHWDWLKQNK